MAYKNKVSLRVCGRNMTLAGNESVEYMTEVANYIEEKTNELRNSSASKNLSPQMISVLTSINIADDYFKKIEETKKLKALFPENFDVDNAKPGMLFVKGEEADGEKSASDMEAIKAALAEAEEKLEAIENKNISLEEENRRAKAEIERLKEYEELFEDYDGSKRKNNSVVEKITTDDDFNGITEENEVFENQLEIGEEEESKIENTDEPEFLLKDEDIEIQEEPVKKENRDYTHKHNENNHKAHSGGKNYYRHL